MNTYLPRYVRIHHKRICYTVIYTLIYTFLLNKFLVCKFPTKTSTFFAIYNFLISVFYPWQSILPGTYHISILLAISLVSLTYLGTSKDLGLEKKTSFYV